MSATTNYTISTDGTTISALNTVTGKVDFSGTDATAVIMSAAVANSKVLIKAGTYIINHAYDAQNSIVISNSNVELYGEGQLVTILKLADGANRRVLSIFNTTNVYVHDLQIDGDRANQNQSPGSPASFEDGINAWQSTSITISNNYVHDVRNFGVTFSACSNSQILNNLIVNSDANGITIDNEGGQIGVTISGNTVDGASDVGITVWYGSGVLIENNTIRNIMMNTSPYSANSHTALYTENNSPNNTFRNNTLSNVKFGFSDDNSTGIIIDGNTFNLQSLTPNPFWTGSSSGGTFSNNTIYLVTTGGALQLSAGWTLQNNVIEAEVSNTTNITFSGTVSAQAATGEAVTVKVTKPDGTVDTWTATTLANLTYSVVQAYAAGSYSAQASIAADAAYVAAQSSVIQFTVGLQPRTVTLSAA